MPGPKPARLKCVSAGDCRLARGAATEDADEGCGSIVRVLVVDDDPVTRHLVSHFLRNLGHQVDVAMDGLAALQMFQQHRFPVVITDWEMPGLNGLELCQKIRDIQLPGYTYIILLTSLAERRHLIQGFSAGADDFASKPFDPEEIRVRLRAAERILTLERKLLEANRSLTAVNGRLQKMSRLDPLMEIGNRMALEEEVAPFHHHAEEHGEPYGVVMCDVDHFKRFNDRYGHQFGDEVLRQVAAEIRKGIRSHDRAFRYGGEEVLVLLSRQNAERSVAVVERIRRHVEDLRFMPPDGETCGITISCGVSSYPESFDGLESWHGLVERADQALYQAKAAGRNRVVAYAAADPVSVEQLAGG